MKTKRLIMTVLSVVLLSGCGLGNAISKATALAKSPFKTLWGQAWIVVEPPDPKATDVEWTARKIGSHPDDKGIHFKAEESRRKIRALAMTLAKGQTFWCDYRDGVYGLTLTGLEVKKQVKRGPEPPAPTPPGLPPMSTPPRPGAAEIVRPAEEGGTVSGTVSGTVLATVDGVGGILSGVDVRLRSHSGDVNRVNSTDDFGGYSFHNVRPGDYIITFELDGYESVRVELLRVESGVALTMPAVIMFQDD